MAIDNNKVIFSGLESSGKSLRLAMQADYLVTRNSRWFDKTGTKRPIAPNFDFSSAFVAYAETKNVPIRRWRTLEELMSFGGNIDVMIDEVGTFFDARFWADLSIDVRSWVAQGAKSGIQIYGGAQDFAQVDISFRRLVNELYHITKIAGSPRPAVTRPPVESIWGLCAMKKLDPRNYDEKNPVNLNFMKIPSFFTIRKKYCDMFDTTQKIERSPPLPYKHIVRKCNHVGCGFTKIIHV